MKKLVSLDLLKNVIRKCKEWMNKWNRNDDDYFDHPFAIL